MAILVLADGTGAADAPVRQAVGSAADVDNAGGTGALGFCFF